MKLIENVVANRRIVIFLSLMVAVAGFFLYFEIPKQENPDVAAPVAMLTTILPGASPTETEQLVTSPLEDAAAELRGIENTQSWSTWDMSIILVTLKNGVDPELSWNELRRKISDEQKKLPEGCEPTDIDTKLIETAGMIIALSGENYSYEQLNSFAEQYKNALSDVEGVDRFEIVGKVEKEVSVKIDHIKIQHFGIELEQVRELLAAQNISIPSGSIDINNSRINVRIPGRFQSIRDVENVIIRVSTKSGHSLRLKDIAEVSIEEVEGAKKIRQNRANAVLLVGFFQPGQNIIDIGKDVRENLKKMEGTFPNDLLITEVTFESDDIQKSVASFMSNVLQGIGLVIIVVFIGMGFRNAVTVSLAIPLSILCTFIGMHFLGIKIHQISTVTLIIALGMLVDNAIVVSDAVQVRLDNGNIKAASEGATKSAIPIFAATLTTIAAFSPLLSLPGATGEFLIAIPQIMIIALSASFIIALFITPSVASIVFKPYPQKRKKKKNYLLIFFDKLLSMCLNKPFFTVLVAILAFIGSLFLSSSLPSQLFPTADKNILYIDINGFALDINKTEELTKEIEDLLYDEPSISSFTSSIGDDLPRFYITASVATPSSDYAQIMLRADLDNDSRFNSYKELALYLQKKLDSKIVDGFATVRLLESTDPKEGSVVLRVSGDNIDILEKKAAMILEKLKQIDGTINHYSDSPSRAYNYSIDIDEDAALTYGISKYHIQRQVNLALMGEAVSVYRKGGREFDIRLSSSVNNILDLMNLPVLSQNGSVLIGQVASVNLKSEYDLIKKFNRKRSITVFCDTLPGVSPSEVEDKLEYELLPQLSLEGCKISYAGEREDIERDFGKLGQAAVIAIILIYIILLIQFRSFIQPIVILVTVPLSLVGSFLGLWIFSQPLSFTALLGVASLIGIVVNNAILLLEFINDALKEGCNIKDACREALRKRFRPIMLSTITTVSGLIPLVLSGSELFTPMAVALMSGLLISTLLTLIVIPVVFMLIVPKKA